MTGRVLSSRLRSSGSHGALHGCERPVYPVTRYTRAICKLHIDVIRMRRPRARRPHRRGWSVNARVERFSEPALLLLLRDRPAHGYELVDSLTELVPGRPPDMGNLYRTLRALEAEGLVRSEWDAQAPGPAKRMYRLTDAGRRLLGEWAAALGQARDRIDAFLRRYETERR